MTEPNKTPQRDPGLQDGQWPYLDEEMIEAAGEVLRSGKVNYWTGTQGKTFEQEFSAACGVRYGAAVSNGTTALEAALYAVGVGPGDEVIVPSRTYIATASSVARMGAIPVVADVDEESQNLTAATISPTITPRTRAVIAVHLAGWPCDMDSINELAAKHGLRVIEDCAQSHGAKYRDRSVGSLGDIAAFSFCQDKIMTTAGEGGMVVTDDRTLWKRAWAYKDHGKDYDVVHDPNAAPGFRWVHHQFGTNARMTEVQAVIGRIALRRLPDWVNTRRRNASILEDRLVSVPCIRVTTPPQDVRHAYYRSYVFLRTKRLREGWSREQVLNRLREVGVPCYTGSCSEIYLEKAFEGLRASQHRLPTASQLGETSLAFLVHPTLAETDMHRTANAAAEVLSEATDPVWITAAAGGTRLSA